ncbi:putative POM121-like protein 1 isoform X3 [Pan troglodytes]|uniref:putative POM121-like protein 1 isoform X3 n=1 Tax=Pan troglodytes TaxID=9598 RepID=UPI003013895D
MDSLWGPGAGSHPFGVHNTRLSPDLCPGKIVLRALKESGAGIPEQDKDPRVQENPGDQRRVPEVTGDARSAFRPLRDNGGLSPFVPRPGPLQTDLHAQRSEIRYKQTSQTSWTSSCTNRNAISSSYSSTGGLPGLKRRRGPASSHCQLTLSSSKTDPGCMPISSPGQLPCKLGELLKPRWEAADNTTHGPCGGGRKAGLSRNTKSRTRQKPPKTEGLVPERWPQRLQNPLLRTAEPGA